MNSHTSTSLSIMAHRLGISPAVLWHQLILSAYRVGDGYISISIFCAIFGALFVLLLVNITEKKSKIDMHDPYMWDRDDVLFFAQAFCCLFILGFLIATILFFSNGLMDVENPFHYVLTTYFGA